MVDEKFDLVDPEFIANSGSMHGLPLKLMKNIAPFFSVFYGVMPFICLFGAIWKRKRSDRWTI